MESQPSILGEWVILSESFAMRGLYVLILILIVAALALFAYQNGESVTLQYFQRSVTLPMSLLIVVVYLLGMLSGWTVVGFLRRSWRGAMDRPQK
jgi:uncharacterized integral membrane protein